MLKKYKIGPNIETREQILWQILQLYQIIMVAVL
jgi:hypothetical protein